MNKAKKGITMEKTIYKYETFSYSVMPVKNILWLYYFYEKKEKKKRKYIMHKENNYIFCIMILFS